EQVHAALVGLGYSGEDADAAVDAVAADLTGDVVPQLPAMFKSALRKVLALDGGRTHGAALRQAPGLPQPWREQVHAALVGLGYSGEDADAAVDAVAADLTGDEVPQLPAALKSALRKLSR
ncbi:hypothetical protein ACF087_32475, partial [Streptomyces goshikiensis]